MFRQLLLLLSCLSAALGSLQAADVNVLIIGSQQTASNHWSLTGDSVAFNPTAIRADLEGILNGDAAFGNVTVTFQDYTQQQPSSSLYSSTNLSSWFHWPFPADVETTTRWPDLRGENGTVWDYVVLIGDPFTIETMPGVYAHGVATIAEMVSRGSAETVLLMPWPKSSSSTVERYREVVYRVGRSGGFKVAPAGLAWQAAGSPVDTQHPSSDGAYIAAASLYSRIWGKSASNSNYKPDSHATADLVHSTVSANIGAPQYSGPFVSDDAFTRFDDKRRKIDFRYRTSSTERGFHEGAVAAARLCKIDKQIYFNYPIVWTLGRADSGLNRYSNPYWHFYYHTQNSENDYHLREISYKDMRLANEMDLNSAPGTNLRLLPRRFLWAMVHQELPAENPMADGTHLSGIADEAVGAYLYTLFSGRCPIVAKPNPVTAEWIARKAGYEMAWRVGHCHSRAPGFRVLPSSTQDSGLEPGSAESMTVQFMLPPQEEGVVQIASSDPSVATVSPQTLTFTPQNHETAQSISVNVAANAPTKTSFTIEFTTSSNDIVYEGLHDSWEYTVNTPPTAALAANPNPLILPDGASSVTTLLTSNASDAEGDRLYYQWSKLNGPGTVTFTGARNATAEASFSKPGIYNLKCRIYDSHTPVASTLAVEVLPETITLREPDNPANTVNGVEYELYDGLSNLSTVDHLGGYYGGDILATGVVDQFTFTGHPDEESGQFGYLYRGYIDVAEDGFYTFYLNSCSGSTLTIGNTQVVNNDGNHTLSEQSGAIGLSRGKHQITVRYFFNHPYGSAALQTYWAGPGIARQPIPNEALYRISETPVPDAPIAYDQDVRVNPGNSTPITLTASDADGDPLSYTVLSQPSVGSLSGNAPDLTYTAPADHFGVTSFTFKASDGTLESREATVTVDIRTTNPPQVDAGPKQTVAEDNPAPAGLWYGEVSGNLNATTANPKTLLLVDPSTQTENGIGGNTTEIYTGYIYDADGQISFTEHIDDIAVIWVNGIEVLNNATWNLRTSSGNLNLSPGWHALEIRISNGGGGSGPVGSPGIGFDPAGGTAWQTLSDPGDASLLLSGAPGTVANLQGSASDLDGDPLTYTWSFVSGPETATIEDPTLLNTPAYFPVKGSYVLRLEANDGFTTISDDVTITVGYNAIYKTWTEEGFNNPFTSTNPGEDPDNDGLSNMAEFAFGMDPTTSMTAPLDYELNGNLLQAGTPKVSPDATTASGYQAIFCRRKDHLEAGLSYTCEFSYDLKTWTRSTATPTVLTSSSSSGDVEVVSVPYPDSVPLANGDPDTKPRFFRLRLSVD